MCLTVLGRTYTHEPITQRPSNLSVLSNEPSCQGTLTPFLSLWLVLWFRISLSYSFEDSVVPQRGLLCYCWPLRSVTLLFMDMAPLVHWFTCWWTFDLLPALGSYKNVSRSYFFLSKTFKVCNLMSFDTCIYSENHCPDQNTGHVSHSQSFLLTLHRPLLHASLSTATC